MQLRLKALLAVATVLLLLCALYRPMLSALHIDATITWGALALVAFALYQVVRPSHPARMVDRAPQHANEQARHDPTGDLAHKLREVEAKLEHEIEARRAAQQALHEADERYSLAVRGASDGLWEWDLHTGTMYFSPLWKSLLGYDDSEIGTDIEQWHHRIHPEDRARVLKEMDDHLAGHSPRFENEHRLLHKDQSWHWVHARGTAIRHAAGSPYRVIGLHTDITARRAAEQMLLEVAESLATARGEVCFQIVARSFAQVMGVREAFVCEPCDQPPTKARMLAWWCEGRFLPNVEYELEGTPCKNPQVEGRTCYCSKGLEEQWPLEKPFDRTAYLGIPIRDSAGAVIGHIACTDNKPMPERTPHLAIFKLFAERASVELERRALLRGRVGIIAPPA
jgi:PAS domain S-box-containing protein